MKSRVFFSYDKTKDLIFIRFDTNSQDEIGDPVLTLNYEEMIEVRDMINSVLFDMLISDVRKEKKWRDK